MLYSYTNLNLKGSFYLIKFDNQQLNTSMFGISEEMKTGPSSFPIPLFAYTFTTNIPKKTDTPDSISAN
jgi:hypothetical protein